MESASRVLKTWTWTSRLSAVQVQPEPEQAFSTIQPQLLGEKMWQTGVGMSTVLLLSDFPVHIIQHWFPVDSESVQLVTLLLLDVSETEKNTF